MTPLDQWYYSGRDGSCMGPVRLETLRLLLQDRVLRHDSLVRNLAMSIWMPIYDVPELKNDVVLTPPPLPIPSSTASVAPTVAAPAQPPGHVVPVVGTPTVGSQPNEGAATTDDPVSPALPPASAATSLDPPGASGVVPQSLQEAMNLIRTRLDEGCYHFADLIKWVIDQAGPDKAHQVAPVLEGAWERVREEGYQYLLGPAESANELILQYEVTRITGEKDAAASSLDELFTQTVAYRSSKQYMELMRFITRFRRYSPYNCFLMHMQNPSVSFVSTRRQWARDYGRWVKPDARPMVILAPKSPVLFVYDITDTDGKPLPAALLAPFATSGMLPPGVWDHTKRNLGRDRIHLVEKPLGTQSAGCIGRSEGGHYVQVGKDSMEALYDLIVNSTLDPAARYVTLVHELAHLYCGHLGTPDERWWPDRRDVSHNEQEFEAESVAYLVAGRLGIKNPSAEYLSGYLGKHDQVPPISLDTVLKATKYVESMGQEKLPARKDKE